MKSNSPAPLAARTIPVSVRLEFRITPTADTRGEAITGLDLRLWRRIPMAGDGFAPTAAGFRLPVTSLRRLAAALSAFADELGVQ